MNVDLIVVLVEAKWHDWTVSNVADIPRIGDTITVSYSTDQP